MGLFAAAFFLYAYMFSGLFMAGATGAAADVKYTSILFYAWEALFANEFREGSTFRFNPAGVSMLEDTPGIELTGSVLLELRAPLRPAQGRRRRPHRLHRRRARRDVR